MEKSAVLNAKLCSIEIWNILSSASHIDFVHEKRRMDVLLETPLPLETSRTFFDISEALGALFMLQPLRLSIVAGPDNEHTYILKI